MTWMVRPASAQSGPAGTSHHRVDRSTRAASLLGTWRMTSLEIGTQGDLHPVPYSGQVVFTKTGNMPVQAANPDASAPDTPYTRSGYEAFYGDFSVNKVGGTFAVTASRPWSAI